MILSLLLSFYNFPPLFVNVSTSSIIYDILYFLYSVLLPLIVLPIDIIISTILDLDFQEGLYCLISLASTIHNYPPTLQNYKNVNFE